MIILVMLMMLMMGPRVYITLGDISFPSYRPSYKLLCTSDVNIFHLDDGVTYLPRIPRCLIPIGIFKIRPIIKGQSGEGHSLS